MKLRTYLAFSFVALLFQEGTSFAMESLEQPEKMISTLLSLKFSYNGPELAEKIEEIKYGSTYQNINQETLYKALNKKKLTDKNSLQKGVTVYLPFQLSENDNNKNYLIAAAYYPWEFEPRELYFSQTCSLMHIHQQLSYALHYGHPLAASELKRIANVYFLSSEHRFYQILKQNQSNQENFEPYFIPVSTQNTPYVLDKIDLDSKLEKERNQYFEELSFIIEKGYKN